MAEARVERRLAAILAADVAGYSRLMGVDEEGTLAVLKAYRRELVDPKISEHRGRIVKTTGDGALVEFASAVDAVRCATEIQRTMAARNAAIPEDRRIEFRIGINVGDIIIDEGDIYGDGVNIAARLEAIAEPGGICVSDKVHQEIRGKVDVFARDIGLQTLKNIAEPVRVYEIAQAAIKTRLEDLGVAPGSFAWPAKDKPNAEPYPGLSALGGVDAGVCTASQRATAPDARQPAPLVAIDQGEELFAVEDAQESAHFLQLLAGLQKVASDGVDLYVLITIRADSVESLLQCIAELGLEAPEPLYLMPLSPGAYRDVILKPAEVYTRNVSRLAIEPALADRLVADATGADALPLLAFTLSQLFKLHGACHELTLAQYNEIGGMGGCVTRVLRQAQRSAETAGSDDNLRRLIVPGLATWDPAASAAKRLVAKEAQVVGGRRAALARLGHALV